MDPNATLARIRELVKEINESAEEGFNHHKQAWELAELVGALDEWIKKGGFFPEEWLDDWVKPMRQAMAEAHGLKSGDELPGFEASVYSTCSLSTVLAAKWASGWMSTHAKSKREKPE